MRGDLPIGRLAGIKVGLNWSALIMAAVSTMILALNWLPISEPGMSAAVYWTAGVLGALLFFGSLLVHEMGHALVAKDEGIGVHSISLWMLGGVARLESSPTEPGSEFRIAVVGPLGSAACGAVFLCLSYVLPGGGLAGVTGSLFLWLGLTNLILAGFNLLPATPLDGGTVLSALIWRTSGRQATGMLWAARAGLVVGSALAIIGFRNLGGNYGISLLAIGVFIAFGAWQNLKAAPLWDLLEGIVAAEGMTPAAHGVPGATSVSDFLTALPPDTPHRSFPVTGADGRVAGLLTVDAVRAAPQASWPHLRVIDLAYPIDRLTIVRADEPLLPAVQKVESGDVPEGLVVRDDGTVVGTLRSAAIHTAVEHRRTQLAAEALAVR